MRPGFLEDWNKRTIRYSPQPLHRYYYFDEQSGNHTGYAYCFLDSPLGWNLYWLCEPNLDRFLAKPLNLGSAIEAQSTLERSLFHKCLFAIDRDDVGPDPFLRTALTLPPTEFMARLESRLPLRHIPLFAHHFADSPLLVTMWQRARRSDNVLKTVKSRIDNVITVDFRCSR